MPEVVVVDVFLFVCLFVCFIASRSCVTLQGLLRYHGEAKKISSSNQGNFTPTGKIYIEVSHRQSKHVLQSTLEKQIEKSVACLRSN